VDAERGSQPDRGESTQTNCPTDWKSLQCSTKKSRPNSISGALGWAVCWRITSHAGRLVDRRLMAGNATFEDARLFSLAIQIRRYRPGRVDESNPMLVTTVTLCFEIRWCYRAARRVRFSKTPKLAGRCDEMPRSRSGRSIRKTKEGRSRLGHCCNDRTHRIDQVPAFPSSLPGMRRHEIAPPIDQSWGGYKGRRGVRRRVSMVAAMVATDLCLWCRRLCRISSVRRFRRWAREVRRRALPIPSPALDNAPWPGRVDEVCNPIEGKR